MSIQRSIVHFTAIAAAVAMLVPACAAAEAGSPLLSGYGGPGSGSQAILGSGLVNLGGGGGGGTGSGASAAQGSGPSGQTAAQGASGGSGGSSGSGRASSGGSRTGSAGSSAAGSSPSATVVVLSGANSQNVVLPGDIVDIVLGLLVLALTAALTVVLARRSTDDAR